MNHGLNPVHAPMATCEASSSSKWSPILTSQQICERTRRRSTNATAHCQVFDRARRQRSQEQAIVGSLYPNACA